MTAHEQGAAKRIRVAITVKVPHHFELASAALTAGKADALHGRPERSLELSLGSRRMLGQPALTGSLAAAHF